MTDQEAEGVSVLTFEQLLSVELATLRFQV
jgi:hypothetical protein